MYLKQLFDRMQIGGDNFYLLSGCVLILPRQDLSYWTRSVRLKKIWYLLVNIQVIVNR